MKLAKKLVDSVKPKFAKGSKLEKYHYLFEAFETFLFVPDKTTKNGVHVRDAMDLKEPC